MKATESQHCKTIAPCVEKETQEKPQTDTAYLFFPIRVATDFPINPTLQLQNQHHPLSLCYKLSHSILCSAPILLLTLSSSPQFFLQNSHALYSWHLQSVLGTSLSSATATSLWYRESQTKPNLEGFGYTGHQESALLCPRERQKPKGEKKKAPQNKTHTQKEVGNMVRTEKRGEMKKYSNTRHPLA